MPTTDNPTQNSVLLQGVTKAIENLGDKVDKLNYQYPTLHLSVEIDLGVDVEELFRIEAQSTKAMPEAN